MSSSFSEVRLTLLSFVSRSVSQFDFVFPSSPYLLTRDIYILRDKIPLLPPPPLLNKFDRTGIGGFSGCGFFLFRNRASSYIPPSPPSLERKTRGSISFCGGRRKEREKKNCIATIYTERTLPNTFDKKQDWVFLVPELFLSEIDPAATYIPPPSRLTRMYERTKPGIDRFLCRGENKWRCGRIKVVGCSTGYVGGYKCKESESFEDRCRLEDG